MIFFVNWLLLESVSSEPPVQCGCGIYIYLAEVGSALLYKTVAGM